MLVEKLMMPYVLASQHYMINLAFFVAMLWNFLDDDKSKCFYESAECYIDRPDNVVTESGKEDIHEIQLAYEISMWTNFISFCLHFTI